MAKKTFAVHFWTGYTTNLGCGDMVVTLCERYVEKQKSRFTIDKSKVTCKLCLSRHKFQKL
jgi:hypothetical protein